MFFLRIHLSLLFVFGRLVMLRYAESLFVELICLIDNTQILDKQIINVLDFQQQSYSSSNIVCLYFVLYVVQLFIQFFSIIMYIKLYLIYSSFFFLSLPFSFSFPSHSFLFSLLLFRRNKSPPYFDDYFHAYLRYGQVM